MARKSTARPSKPVLDLIVHGRSCIGVTIGGQARIWQAFETPAHHRTENERQWRVELRGGWPEDVLATYDVYRDLRTGRITCLAEGWQDRMMI